MQDVKSKRNPRLVPYSLLDERTKKSNRDSLREAIRTLIGYGYNIEPPDQEGGRLSLPHEAMLTYTEQYKTSCVDTVAVFPPSRPCGGQTEHRQDPFLPCGEDVRGDDGEVVL